VRQVQRDGSSRSCCAQRPCPACCGLPELENGTGRFFAPASAAGGTSVSPWHQQGTVSAGFPPCWAIAACSLAEFIVWKPANAPVRAAPRTGAAAPRQRWRRRNAARCRSGRALHRRTLRPRATRLRQTARSRATACSQRWSPHPGSGSTGDSTMPATSISKLAARRAARAPPGKAPQ
jgi:hypothetical protein